MRKRLVKRTSNFIAKETAFIVFVILLILAGMDTNRKLEAARLTPIAEDKPECAWTPDGHGICELGRAPGTLDQYRGN